MIPKLMGTIGELRVATDLMEEGYPVFRELGDSSRCDLITETDIGLIRIQVKSTKLVDGIVNLYVRKACGTYKGEYRYNYTYNPSDFDLFALFVPEKDEVLYVNAQWVLARCKSCFRLRYDDPKQFQANIQYAKDFLSFKEALSVKPE